MNPWGTVRVRDVRARGASGRLTANASATFRGFTFESADGQLTIPPLQKVPLTLEGVPMGEASGTLKVHAQRAPDDKTIDVRVEAPQVEVELERASTHSVQ